MKNKKVSVVVSLGTFLSSQTQLILKWFGSFGSHYYLCESITELSVILFIFLFPLFSHYGGRGKWEAWCYSYHLMKKLKLNPLLGSLVKIVTKASQVVGFFSTLGNVLLDLRSLKWPPLRRWSHSLPVHCQRPAVLFAQSNRQGVYLWISNATS